MTGTIITGAHLTGVTLNKPATENPATIAASGTVSNTSTSFQGALTGVAGTAWTVSNFGTVNGTGPASNGIYLHSGGEVTNGSSTATKALIESTGYGVVVLGTKGTIANFGTIEGTSPRSIGAVLLAAGGIVTNGGAGSASGLIKGSGGGVVVSGATGTIANFGTIEGTSTYSGGVYLRAGGGVTNSTHGFISGFIDAIAIGHATGTVVNSGTIDGTGTSSLGIFLTAGGNVTNGASGSTAALIEGGTEGIDNEVAGGTVTNFGTIAGTAFNGVVLDTAGSVINGSSALTKGLIEGGFNGVLVTGAGTVTNYGTIQGTGKTGVGVDLGNGSVTNGSSASTKALIAGYQNGIIFVSAAGAGAVTNFGTIKAIGTSASAPGTGVGLQAGGVLTNGSAADRNAVISSSGRAISIGGTAGGSGTVTNFGTIVTTGTAPVPLAPAIYLGGGGTITNYGLVKGAVPTIGGSQGVITTRHQYATIRNFGTIAATNGNDAIHLDHGGTIINGSASDKTALISGLHLGVTGGLNPSTHVAYGAGAAGTVVNYGTIKDTGTGAAIGFVSGGTVTNHGLIEGTGTGNPGGTGITLAGGVAKVTNSGTVISVGENGFGVDLGANGYVRNTGLISLYHIGIYANTATSTGTVVNLGTIKSTQKATPITFTGDGILLEKGGRVTNGSTIDSKAVISAVDGVAVSMHGNGTLTNFGTLTSTNTAHPTVNLIAGGRVTNGAATALTALISSNDIALNMTGAAGTVTNFGTIDDTGTINPAIYLGAGGRVTNFGTITGATGIAVAVGNTAAITLTNAGRIVGTGGTAVAFGGGNDVLTVDAGAVFTGAVTGGGGTNEIVQGAAGTLAVAGFSGFETIVLFKGGVDTLTLRTANFTGVTGAAITVTGGSEGNTVSASGAAAADHIVVHAGKGADVLTGGLGNDVFYAGGNTTMTGHIGANEFIFTAPGGNTIKDFHVSATNELVFSNAGFNLGLAGGTATPQELTAAEAATLFTTGNFTAASQRLAYDQATGQLFAGSDGSGGPKSLVATLSDHAAIGSSQLFFIA